MAAQHLHFLGAFVISPQAGVRGWRPVVEEQSKGWALQGSTGHPGAHGFVGVWFICKNHSQVVGGENQPQLCKQGAATAAAQGRAPGAAASA